MGDDASSTDQKLDNLTATVNRLSQQFDDYTSKQPPGAQGGEVVATGDQEGYVEGKTDFSQDENEERGNWTGKIDFLLACLGYAVGLGNVWRFPYLCYKNGGAIFFIPYVIMLFFVGMPIFFLELSLGQFTSNGPLTCWQCCDFFKGIGVGMTIVSSFVAIYYNMIIAWAIWYLFSSLINCMDLPWGHCDNDFNTRLCYYNFNSSLGNETQCSDWGYLVADDGVCYNVTLPDDTDNSTWGIIGFWNDSLAKENGFKRVLPSEEYLNRRVFGKDFSSGIGDMGEMRWELVLCLLAAWGIVILSLIKGVKSSGKVVYFTALFPYAVLIILLVRGLLLEGHQEGIQFYIANVDLSKLADADVWKDAASQIFFSLSASWGGLITLSSYNRFHNDVLRDTLIVSLGNCLTSFFAGFVIFSFLGFLAHELNTTVDNVAESGVGLAFIVYPDAVSRMEVSALWAVLFFIMIITLGLDSEFALVETVSTALMDQFPYLRKKKELTICGIALVGFLCGLPLCCNGGAYVLQLMDFYAGGWNVLVLALCECICIAYVYGFCRFKEDIRLMIGQDPCNCCTWNIVYWWWGLCWYILTPACVIFIMIFSWVRYGEVKYDDYEYPRWAHAIGWIMTMAVIGGIFITAIVQVIMKLVRGEPVRDLFRPNKYWGPALVRHRKLVLRYVSEDQFVVDPWAEDEAVQMDQIKVDYDNPGYEEKF